MKGIQIQNSENNLNFVPKIKNSKERNFIGESDAWSEATLAYPSRWGACARQRSFFLELIN